jgi:hypothetical protein
VPSLVGGRTARSIILHTKADTEAVPRTCRGCEAEAAAAPEFVLPMVGGTTSERSSVLVSHQHQPNCIALQ